MPLSTSIILFGMSVPQSLLLYDIIWADPCSFTMFRSYEKLMTWIATCSALEGSAACALGYIDYRTLVGNSDT